MRKTRNNKVSQGVFGININKTKITPVKTRSDIATKVKIIKVD